MGKDLRFYAGWASESFTHLAMASLLFLAANQISRPYFPAGSDLPPGVKTGCTDGSLNKLFSCINTGAEVSDITRSWTEAFTQKFGHSPMGHINDALMAEVSGIESQLNTLKDRKDSAYTSIGQLNIRDQHTEAYTHTRDALALLKIAYANDQEITSLVNSVSFQKIKIKAANPKDKDKTEERVNIPTTLFKSNKFQIFTILTNAHFRDQQFAANFTGYMKLDAGTKTSGLYVGHATPEVAKAIVKNIDSCRPLAEIIPSQTDNMEANPLLFKDGTLTPRGTISNIRKVMLSYAPFANSWLQAAGRRPDGFVGHAIRSMNVKFASKAPSCTPKG